MGEGVEPLTPDRHIQPVNGNTQDEEGEKEKGETRDGIGQELGHIVGEKGEERARW